jgi:tetratricopeptide (TPR) repeat protein
MQVEDMLERAMAAVAQQDAEGAKLWFGQVLASQPRHAMALAGKGQALCWQKRVREGLVYLREAARQLEKTAQRDRNVTFILELAEQLHHWGDLDTAIRLARLAVRLAPNAPAPRNNLALYLLRVNRAEEALPHAEKALEYSSEHPACLNLWAILQARLGRLDAAVKGFRAVIAAGRDAAQTARAWAELVTVLDQQGAHDDAFGACMESKRLQRQLPDFKAIDEQAIYRRLVHNRTGFTESLTRRWSRADFLDDLPAPIFLMGFLRSGTTLTEQVLAAHPAIQTSDENGLIHDLAGKLGRMTQCGENLPQGVRQLTLAQARELRAHYWARVAAEYGYGRETLSKRFVDKVALNTMDVGLISALFPEAKIVFALRDPRDVCLSCFMQTFKPSSATINLLSWEGIARQYAAVMELWLAQRETLAPDYLEVRYEDTVHRFEETFRRVFAFLELPWTEAVSAYHEHVRGRYIATPSFAAVSQPLYATSAQRWRRYEPHFAPILPLLRPYLQAFGYA